MNSIRTATSVAVIAVVLTLTGCGSSDDAGSASTTDASPENSATPPAGGGFDEAQIQEIRECLDAAGLEDAFPTDMPTDMPSEMPTDMPSDLDPENLPEGFPSEGAGGGGGGFAALQDPEVQDALEACGVELPQMPSSPSS